jgi:hypothetical protein
MDLGTLQQLVAIVRDLGVGGCFVKSTEPFPKGTEVRVRITCSGTDFSAIGKVAGHITAEGMGIEFTSIEPMDQAIMESLLGLEAEKNVLGDHPKPEPRSDEQLVRETSQDATQRGKKGRGILRATLAPPFIFHARLGSSE